MSDEFVPSRLQLFMDDLAVCVCNEVSVIGQLCWCGIWPGDEVSWEGCSGCANGACGMAWVRLVGTFPYEAFPVPSVDLNCRLPLAFAIEIGVLRCMPIANEDGTIPSPSALAETAMIGYADMHALYRALVCCPAEQIAVEGWTPVGPDGGCVGGGWTAYVSLD